MSMTYTSLISPKGTSGSIANWVNYAKLDLPTILDESQSLLFSMLRVREMRTEWTFAVSVGQSCVPLRARFLDPDGPIIAVGQGLEIDMRPEQDLSRQRFYDSSISGSFDTGPITTTLNSSLVNVEKTGHGLTQDSTITMAALDPVGGLTLNGAYPIVAIVDADNFTIDTGDQAATSTATGGGVDATYTANLLIAGTPSRFSVFDEQIKFDTAFDTASTLKLLYFRAPLLLSDTNQSNWLTNRYPLLLRAACQAGAADYMKDDTEYQKAMQRLQSLIERTGVEGDLMYRGMQFGTETP